MSATEILLERLEGVRDRGHGQWLARCPAHDDKGPSLSIKETSDGVVLIHCFALCSPTDVVGAVGLELTDLFPEKIEPQKGARPRWPAKDLLLIVRDEVTTVACIAGRMAEGKEIPKQELDRVGLAVGRIYKALGVGNVR